MANELNDAMLPKVVLAKKTGADLVISYPIAAAGDVYVTSIANGKVNIFLTKAGHTGVNPETAQTALSHHDAAVVLTCAANAAATMLIVRQLTGWFARSGTNVATNPYNARVLDLNGDKLDALNAALGGTAITAVDVEMDSSKKYN
tara:strand:+ start:224 stop:661 length:438 start_codon:yes stop_codon:yes gene_type:complete